MDIHLVFQKKGAAHLEVPNPRKPTEGKLAGIQWALLHHVKVKFQKEERIDLDLMAQLRQEWHSARRKLRSQRRQCLRQAACTGDKHYFKEAAGVRGAYVQLARGLRELKKQQADQRKGEKIRCGDRVPSLEQLRVAVEISVTHREQLWLQRFERYKHFYRGLMSLVWLKEGWPLEVGLDHRLQPVDLSRSTLRGEGIQKLEALERCLTYLRQLEAELDLFCAKLTPHAMSDQEWDHFYKNQLALAQKSLACSHPSCMCAASHLGKQAQLVCEQHAKGKGQEVQPLPWLVELQEVLSRLATV